MNNRELNDSSILVKNTNFEPSILNDGSWILYNDESGEVVVLNSTAGILWELYSGEHTIEQVALQLAEYYPDTTIVELRKDLYEITPMLIVKNTVSILN